MNIDILLGIITDALFLFLLGWCSYTDLKYREIPNSIIVQLLTLAIIHFTLAVLSKSDWFSFPAGMLLAAPFLFYWHRGGIGGGDVKLIACSGLYLGIWNLAIACMAMLFILTRIQVIRRLQKKNLRAPLPLAPVVLTGCLAPLIIKYIC